MLGAESGEAGPLAKAKSFWQVSESNPSGRSQQTWSCARAAPTGRKVLGTFYFEAPACVLGHVLRYLPPRQVRVFLGLVQLSNESIL